MEWLVKQIADFNVITFVAIVFFNIALSKSNLKKSLKEQSQELYNEIEEVKDTIRQERKT